VYRVCTKEGKAGGKEGRKEGKGKYIIITNHSVVAQNRKRDRRYQLFFWRPRGSDLRRREGDRRNKKRVGGTVGEEVRHGVSLACVKTVNIKRPLGMLDPNPGRGRRDQHDWVNPGQPERRKSTYLCTYLQCSGMLLLFCSVSGRYT
jgi:hypothetical protein